MTKFRSRCGLATTVGLIALGMTTPGLDAALAQSDAVAVAPDGRTVDARIWPRSYKVDGVAFSLYQPQVDSWSGNEIKARQVMEVRTGADEHSYGVLWLDAKTGTDKEARTVTLDDLTVERLSFPNARDKESAYLAAAKKALPTTQLVVSLDAIEAQLAIAGAEQKADNIAVSNAAPDIIVSLEPAMLVLVDGDPAWRASGVSGVERVLNSHAPILRYQNRLYLGHAGKWLTATSLQGDWTVVAQPPAPVTQALDALLKQGGNASQPQKSSASSSDEIKQVYVRTRPTELISIEGQPKFADVPGTTLSYVTNTPADLFLEGDNSWYALISGRWFTASSTNGPWTFVPANKLPADFLKIDSDGPKGAVLASIAGTPEAKEAVVANSVPQTATIQRNDAKFQSSYDGAPQFVAIQGTSVRVARNSPVPVFQVSSGSYAALSNGVWFLASSATGPWQVATQVPSAIYSIPASSQYHYVTYVKVYGSTPDVVYVGYTPGYYGTVVSNNVVVYGSGYSCDPWIGAYYYGCASTYGYGASFAFGAAVGWSLAFGFGWYDPWYGPYWGPWYYPGYYPGYWPGYWGGDYAWGNVYGRWGNSVVAGRGAAWANPYTGNVGRAGRGGYVNEATGGRGWGYAGRNTNVYTGNSTARAGGIRYNPETGRVVEGRGGSAGNIYTGNAAAGGARTVVNTNTGRVTDQAGGAARTTGGATAAGGFNSAGAAGGDAKGAGYVHYDRSNGDVSRGGAVNVNGNIYAGKDGNVYRYEKGSGWESVTGKRGGNGSQTYGPADRSLDRERVARDRGFERDSMSGGGFDQRGSQRPAFDRSSFGNGMQGRMGGFRGGHFRR